MEENVGKDSTGTDDEDDDKVDVKEVSNIRKMPGREDNDEEKPRRQELSIEKAARLNQEVERQKEGERITRKKM